MKKLSIKVWEEKSDYLTEGRPSNDKARKIEEELECKSLEERWEKKAHHSSKPGWSERR